MFCDVDPATHNIDPEQVERLITPETTGILGVHLWGRACPVEALTAIARANGLTLLFDATHAFGCTHGQQAIGRFGDTEVFSFHATKFPNSFEGGAVVTDNDLLAEKIRLMRNFGIAEDGRVVCLGTNAKMHEASAAMDRAARGSRPLSPNWLGDWSRGRGADLQYRPSRGSGGTGNPPTIRTVRPQPSASRMS